MKPENVDWFTLPLRPFSLSCLHRLAADVGSLCACRPRLLFQPQPLADAEPLDLDADEVATCLEALCTV